MKCRAYKFTYTLGSSLYIPLTSRCNTRTLPETRGPNFFLPPSVVSALCRVRDAELAGTSNRKWEPWCQWLDQKHDDDRVALPARPVMTATAAATATKSEPLQEQRPTLQELLEEAMDRISVDVPSAAASDSTSSPHLFKSIVIGGEGEPTLRMDALTQLTKTLHETIHNNNNNNNTAQLPPPTIRLTTNGLQYLKEEDEIAQDLVKANIGAVSVALMTHCPQHYKQLMEPQVAAVGTATAATEESTTTTTTTTTTTKKKKGATVVHCSPHEKVCKFIAACVQAGLEVETTAVDRADVNKHKTQLLSTQLGVQSDVRWRPYFE